MTTTPDTRLLLVDDEELNRDMLSRRLMRHGHQVVTVASGPEALDAAGSQPFDAMLLDVMMPDMSGLEVLRRLRRTHTPEQLPIIMVTARAQSEDIVEALDLGANDYVTKPVDMQVMLARIRAQVARRRAELSLRESHDRLAAAVEGSNDALTGLPNRVMFADRVARLLEHARRVPEFEFAVLMLDVDRFNGVNESLGYTAGDRLLVEAARRLEDAVGQKDNGRRHGPEPAYARIVDNMVARLSGDQFAVLVSGVAHPGDAHRAANRILDAFSKPFELGGQTVFLTMSIGVALSASGYHAEEEMMRDAGIALDRAKEAGRACVELFDVSMRDQVVARLQLETDLRWALGRGELMLDYQPIVELPAQRVTSVEALVRWRHPQRGMLLPAEFLPVAEETGLIVPIGYWVLREVCRQMHEWSATPGALRTLRVGINLSSRHLLVPDLPDRLTAIVREFEVDASRIELELPEKCVTTNVEATRRVFHALKAAGFRLTIDDFGSGYSSLSALQRFPVDRLKIDRSFLSESTAAAETEGVIRGMIDLVNRFDMEVVAGGIEQPDQLEQLAAMQCRFGQGYLISRPMTARSVEDLLVTTKA
jgi:diguanylate cyclase (GGDEF)-like protein